MHKSLLLQEHHYKKGDRKKEGEREVGPRREKIEENTPILWEKNLDTSGETTISISNSV